MGFHDKISLVIGSDSKSDFATLTIPAETLPMTQKAWSLQSLPFSEVGAVSWPKNDIDRSSFGHLPCMDVPGCAENSRSNLPALWFASVSPDVNDQPGHRFSKLIPVANRVLHPPYCDNPNVNFVPPFRHLPASDFVSLSAANLEDEDALGAHAACCTRIRLPCDAQSFCISPDSTMILRQIRL